MYNTHRGFPLHIIRFPFFAVDSMFNTKGNVMKPKIFTMAFAKVYPLYVAKAKRKGRSKGEVDEIIRWLTGYSQKELLYHLEYETDFETFITTCPFPNLSKVLIKGVVCGVRVEEVEDPVMRDIRYLDKMIDELAKGKVMEKILRNPT